MKRTLKLSKKRLMTLSSGCDIPLGLLISSIFCHSSAGGNAAESTAWTPPFAGVTNKSQPYRGNQRFRRSGVRDVPHLSRYVARQGRDIGPA